MVLCAADPSPLFFQPISIFFDPFVNALEILLRNAMNTAVRADKLKILFAWILEMLIFDAMSPTAPGRAPGMVNGTAATMCNLGSFVHTPLQIFGPLLVRPGATNPYTTLSTDSTHSRHMRRVN
jgi:hypothetical protein